MIKDNDGSSQPKGIKSHAELLRKGDEPKVEAIRRRLEAMESEALHSHAMPNEAVRALFMSSLQDCRRALDGKIADAPPQFVTEMLDSLSESLTRSAQSSESGVAPGSPSARLVRPEAARAASSRLLKPPHHSASACCCGA